MRQQDAKPTEQTAHEGSSKEMTQNANYRPKGVGPAFSRA
jgi:hypothetical protein